MQVSVHSDLCIGGGQCVRSAPEVFDQSDIEGTVILLDPHPGEELHVKVREAAVLCPALAIEVIEE